MRFPAVCCAALLVALTGCSDRTPVPVTPPPPPPSAWTLMDSQEVAKELIGDALKRPWVSQFRDRTSHAPGVSVGEITDHSQGQVDIAAFAAELGHVLAASDRVHLVVDGKSDFVIKGAVSAEDGQAKGEPVKLYQIDLKLVDGASGDAICPLPIERTKSDNVAPAAPAAPVAVPAPATPPAGSK
jgi:hypothetical protein